MSHDAFLSSILAAPDDDTPRLVYADYLDETGDPARAEFVRVQCELAALDEADPRRPTLEDREHDLLAEHEPALLGNFRRERDVHSRPKWVFRRGFLDELQLLIWYIDEEIFKPLPFRRLRILGEPYSDVDEPEMLQSGWRSHIRELDLSGWKWSIPEYAPAFEMNDWPRLAGLDLSGVPGLSRLHELLDRSPIHRQLRSLAFGGRSGPAFRWADAANETLDVPAFVDTMADAPLDDLTAFDCGLTSDGLRELLAAPFAGRLKRLDVSDNRIAPDAYRAFQFADRELRLRRLDLSGTDLAAISLEPVLQSRACEELRELEINRCGSARRNMEVVAASPFWAQATHFRAHGGTIPAFTLEPLCATAGPPALRLLDLADNFLRTDGVRLICDAPWAGSLTWLALSRNYLDDESLKVIADSARFAHLRTLHLANNNLDQDRSEGEVVTDTGVRRLADAPSLANLRVLTVSYTGVTDRSVGVLLNAPHWRLSGIGLGGCDLSPAAVAELAASPRLARLAWLDLSQNPRLSGDALMPLAESPYLSRLCELDVGGVYVGERTMQALRERLGPRLSS
jgi:uncharacterized protein (TIGR02996 family)